MDTVTVVLTVRADQADLLRSWGDGVVLARDTAHVGVEVESVTVGSLPDPDELVEVCAEMRGLGAEFPSYCRRPIVRSRCPVHGTGAQTEMVKASDLR